MKKPNKHDDKLVELWFEGYKDIVAKEHRLILRYIIELSKFEPEEIVGKKSIIKTIQNSANAILDFLGVE